MSVCIVTENITRKGGLQDFAGGNQSATDLKTFFDSNFMNSNEVLSPTAGGNLTLNSQNCGPYDYVLKRSDITLASTPTSSEWFTTTKDTRSVIIGVAGNLTLNSGVFLRPPDRKLFMAIYVQGDLTLNSTSNISMTARGANHSGGGNSGGATTAVAIRLATGTFGGVTNPEVPAAGSAAGAGLSVSTTTVGIPAANASGGGLGGGGGGGLGIVGTQACTSGAGAAGTCFSSGGGGGSMYNNGAGAQASGAAVANGGAGGFSWINATGYAGPGAGNPAGLYAGPGAWGVPPYGSSTWKVHRDAGTVSAHASYTFPHQAGWSSGNSAPYGRQAIFEGYENGTAGTTIIYVSGTLSGSGNIDSSGSDGGTDGGGGSGGGSITVFYNTDSSSITPRAPGQQGGGYNWGSGGLGGTGTARKLSGL